MYRAGRAGAWGRGRAGDRNPAAEAAAAAGASFPAVVFIVKLTVTIQ